MVAQLTGVHDFALGSALTLYLHPAQLHVFNHDGALLRAAQRGGGLA
jgi:glycerol transport system ATP-binding protein